MKQGGERNAEAVLKADKMPIGREKWAWYQLTLGTLTGSLAFSLLLENWNPNISCVCNKKFYILHIHEHACQSAKERLLTVPVPRTMCCERRTHGPETHSQSDGSPESTRIFPFVFLLIQALDFLSLSFNFNCILLFQFCFLSLNQ